MNRNFKTIFALSMCTVLTIGLSTIASCSADEDYSAFAGDELETLAEGDMRMGSETAVGGYGDYYSIERESGIILEEKSIPGIFGATATVSLSWKECHFAQNVEIKATPIMQTPDTMITTQMGVQKVVPLYNFAEFPLLVVTHDISTYNKNPKINVHLPIRVKKITYNTNGDSIGVSKISDVSVGFEYPIISYMTYHEVEL